MAHIYKITNDINERVYIGATIKTYKQRFTEHKYNYRKYPHRPLYKAMSELGVEHFKVELIEECSDSQKHEREIYWINQYKSMIYGYNATYGGIGKSSCNYNRISELYDFGLKPTDIQEITGYSIPTITKVLKADGISKQELKELNAKNFPDAKFCSGCKHLVRATDYCYFCGKRL